MKPLICCVPNETEESASLELLEERSRASGVEPEG